MSLPKPPPEQLRGKPRPIFIRITEMAIKVGLSVDVLRKLAAQGHFGIYRISSRTQLVEERAVMDWVLSQRQKPKHGAEANTGLTVIGDQNQ